MTRNIISFHSLCRQGFRHSFDNENGYIYAYKNDVFYFEVLHCDDVYETIINNKA